MIQAKILGLCLACFFGNSIGFPIQLSRPHGTAVASSISGLPDLSPSSPVEAAMQVCRDLTSPVFLSTNQRTGEVGRGLGHVPLGSDPVILVGNHQMFGLDGVFIVEEFLRQRNTLVTALVYPTLLKDDSPLAPLPYPLPGSANMLRRFGAVPASGRTLLSILNGKNGGASKTALVFPGGAREVFKRKGESYQLKWPKEPMLVQLAARCNATIIPFAAVGGDEFFDEPLLDSDDLRQLPIIGDWLRSRTDSLPSLVDGDVFIPPLVPPRLNGPRRNYFLFGPSISTNDIDSKDIAACDAVYSQVQSAVYAGLDYLLQARADDPNEAAFPRVAMERFNGKKAASFDLTGRWSRVDLPGWPVPQGEVCVIVHEDAPPLCVENPVDPESKDSEVCIMVHEDAPPLCVDPTVPVSSQ